MNLPENNYIMESVRHIEYGANECPYRSFSLDLHVHVSCCLNYFSFLKSKFEFKNGTVNVFKYSRYDSETLELSYKIDISDGVMKFQRAKDDFYFMFTNHSSTFLFHRGNE